MSLQLRTAEEMYDYCVKNRLGWNISRLWAIQHFELIVNAVKPDEEICAVFIGLHNRRSASEPLHYFAYAVTNRRIIIAHKRLLGETMKTVSLDHINDITLVSSGIAVAGVGVGLGTIIVDTIREKFSITHNIACVRNIYEVLHEALDEAKKAQKQTAFNMNTSADAQQVKSPVEQVKELKELLDMGAITQDEFDRKKKELLGL